MPELLLHYIWQRKAFLAFPQTTTDGRRVEVIDSGVHNSDSGPDFLNAKIRIGGVVWVGNVEIHILASDWYRHHHDTDSAYDNIILHVCRRSDKQAVNSKGQVLAQCELQYSLDEQQLERLLIDRLSLCSDRLAIDQSLFSEDWRHKLIADRMQRKAEAIGRLLQRTHGNWEEAFYQTLAHNFGFHTNGLPFELLAQSLPLSFLLKHRDNLFQMEAMLFGQSGLLNEKTATDEYSLALLREYSFLKAKFSLTPLEGSMWRMARMRPASFPHLRIAQAAALLHRAEFLFSQIIEETDLQKLRNMLRVTPSEYWRTHYRFGLESPAYASKLGESAADLLIINTVVPYKYAYSKSVNSQYGQSEAFVLLDSIPAEKNNIISRWRMLGFNIKSATDSQTFIHLYQNYCLQNRCFSCDIGWQIFTVNPHK